MPQQWQSYFKFSAEPYFPYFPYIKLMFNLRSVTKQNHDLLEVLRLSERARAESKSFSHFGSKKGEKKQVLKVAAVTHCATTVYWGGRIA